MTHHERIPEFVDVKDGNQRRVVRVTLRISDRVEFERLVQLAWDRQAKRSIGPGPFVIVVEKLKRK